MREKERERESGWRVTFKRSSRSKDDRASLLPV